MTVTDPGACSPPPQASDAAVGSYVALWWAPGSEVYTGGHDRSGGACDVMFNDTSAEVAGTSEPKYRNGSWHVPSTQN